MLNISWVLHEKLLLKKKALRLRKFGNRYFNQLYKILLMKHYLSLKDLQK